jgi:hypothetical protein
MTSFSYNNNIPLASNNPSVDQPNMEINTNSISSLIAVDHVGFNSSGTGAGGNGGHHLQVTFDSQLTPSTPIVPQSVLFSNIGLADITNSESYFQNAVGTFLLSSIKAFGVFTSNLAASVTSFNNQYNCASISSISNVYTINLKPNVAFGNNIVVFTQANGTSSGSVPIWTFANPVLTLIYNTTGIPVSFIVLQA